MSEAGQDDSVRKGFLSGLGESLRSHIDERLKSPFGGAFIIAWLVVNWEPILILAFGTGPIEARIDLVRESYLTPYAVFIHPIWLAIAIAVAFYLLSAVFIGIFGGYGLVRDKIERVLEKREWVRPDVFLAHKQRSSERLRFVESLATDNLSAIEEERKKTLEANEALIRNQIELGELTSKFNERGEELSRLHDENRGLQDAVASSQSDLSKSLEERARLRNGLHSIVDLLADLRPHLELNRLPTDPSGWNIFLNLVARVDAMVEGVGSNVSEDQANSVGSPSSLNRYLRRKFPGDSVNMSLLSRIVSDIRALDEPEFMTIAGIDHAITRAWPAMEQYKKEKPELFKSSSDYVSKALGFVSPRFRGIHKFSDETKKAFERYGNLVL